jgi:hypothetical protein
MIRSLPLLAGVAGLMLAGTAPRRRQTAVHPGNGQADARNERVLERLLSNPSTRDVKLVMSTPAPATAPRSNSEWAAAHIDRQSQ